MYQSNQSAANLQNSVKQTSVTAPSSSKDDLHPIRKTLDALEETLGNNKYTFLNRYIENYEAPNDSLYTAWKVLHEKWKEIQDSIDRNSFETTSPDIDPVINTILKYPRIERKAKKQSKVSELPKHMSTEKALIILKQKENEKMMKETAKEAKRQKKRKNFKRKNDERNLQGSKTTKKTKNVKRKK